MALVRIARIAILAVLAVSASGAAERALAQSCTREDFEMVVEQATQTLRILTAENRPKFQDRLNQLRQKRGWSHEQFVSSAAPFVRDDTIIALDQKSAALLGQINRLGEGGSSAEGQLDCALLIPLRTSLEGMVAAQTEKWRYMFSKIDAELGR